MMSLKTSYKTLIVVILGLLIGFECQMIATGQLFSPHGVLPYTFDSTGGVIEFDSTEALYGYKSIIPPGALDTSLQILLEYSLDTTITVPDHFTMLSDIIYLKPENFELLKCCTLIVPTDLILLPESTCVYPMTYSSDYLGWQYIPAVIDAAFELALFEVTRMLEYAIMHRKIWPYVTFKWCLNGYSTNQADYLDNQVHDAVARS